MHNKIELKYNYVLPKLRRDMGTVLFFSR